MLRYGFDQHAVKIAWPFTRHPCGELLRCSFRGLIRHFVAISESFHAQNFSVV